MLVITLSIFVFHLVCLFAGAKVVDALLRKRKPKTEISSGELEFGYRQRDPLYLCVCIISSILITSAAIAYYALALEISDDDTPARTLLSPVLAWAYAIYGVVVLPVWMMLIGWAVRKKMTILIFISMITSLIVAWTVWSTLLSQVAWFPGA